MKLGDIPTSMLTGTLKQVDPNGLDEPERQLFDFFFPQFRRLANETPEWFSRKKPMPVFTSESVFLHGGGDRQRRFAGDATLPRARYWSLEPSWPSEPDPEDNQLIWELFAYSSPYNRMDPELIDTTVDVDDAKKLRRRKLISPVPSIVHNIHPHEKGLLPARLRIDNKVQSFRQYPLKIEEVSIDNVLDLRQPESMRWLRRMFWAWAPSLPDLSKQITAPKKSQRRIATLLRLLTAPEIGGGLPILQGLGALLRTRGVAGLVFPSARCDSGALTRDGKLKYHWGFNFVDYRGSGPAEPPDVGPVVLDIPRHPLVHFRIASGNFAGWWIEDMRKASVLAHRYRANEMDDIRDQAWEDLYDGSVLPYDPVYQIGFPQYANTLLWASGSFAKVGDFIANWVWGADDGSGADDEFSYDGESWFLSTAGTAQGRTLLCPRCLLRIRLNAETESPPAMCPKCGLGDIEGHRTWEPPEGDRGESRVLRHAEDRLPPR